MVFFEKSGILAMGSRLRWLADIVTRDAAEIYRMYDIDSSLNGFRYCICCFMVRSLHYVSDSMS